MKKFIKWSFITLFILMFVLLGGFGIYISSIYVNASTIELNEESLSTLSLSLQVFDKDNKPIKEENEINKAYAKIETLNQSTIDAFLSIEDKTFYQHKGVNYKRIAKAFLNNIKSGKLKEGASTITQQLIKNTQLSSEKTLTRKIKEMALAKKIEAKYDKNQILELYLNVVYFGNNCYGIENASNYYFSKPAKDLSVSESAMLAGLLKSPAKYSPIKNLQNCQNRRNLVLNQMYQDGKIKVEDYTRFKSEGIKLNLNREKHNKLNSYSQASIDEAERILKLPARQIAINGYKIYTYQDDNKQKALENAISSQNLDCDSAGMIIDNDKGAVSAYWGSSSFKILESKRQPGSCIKPILVYSPALNEDIIYPCTQLLDEKISIANYSPKNVGNNYHGYVSARESLSKSINIPAVKVLSYVGIDNAKSYAEDMGIEFDEKDNSYTLALGGLTYGVNLLQLCGAYSTFANDGNFIEPKFISFITDKNDKLVYINKQSPKKVLREDCSFLITDMLKTCAQTGTAKRLASLDCEIASKTGTVGKPNSKQNLDAWNISYTKDQTCGIWLGQLDNSPIDYTGGNQPTEIVKSYFSQISDTSRFERPSSVVERKIDRTKLEEDHFVSLANSYMPERFTQTELFSIFNLPKDISNKFTTIEKVAVSSRVENQTAILEFNAKDYVTYEISMGETLIDKISDKSGVQRIIIPLAPDKQKIHIKNYYTLSPQIQQTQEISFIQTEKSSSEKWFI